MTIPDEAVQAASKRIDEYYDTPNCVGETAVRAALTAALPFLQGVKQEPVAWSIIFSDHYGVNCETTFKTKQAAENYVSSCGRGKVVPLYLAPSPRAQALEDLFDAVTLMQKHDEKFEGEIPLATIQKVYTAHTAAIRTLSSQPVADGCKAYVAEMKTFAGIDYFVMIKSGDRELSIRKWQQKHHADYEAAEYNWLFNGGEKPDILAFNPVSGGSSILPASPGASE
ncbi:hypothetical protein ACFQ3K_14590 [Brucella gallinifaecis]|uniref:Uncharacterized protein n=1 Tax=Brucella gallinifaecis TaxID=215590 RepID=A0A502BQ71_9HYPH|nr:hypothetical protein [Brucella gallinifaecis]TPF76692.1 hypothetical protein FHY56_04150 [Brucella gallinifaecis]